RRADDAAVRTGHSGFGGAEPDRTLLRLRAVCDCGAVELRALHPALQYVEPAPQVSRGRAFAPYAVRSVAELQHPDRRRHAGDVLLRKALPELDAEAHQAVRMPSLAYPAIKTPFSLVVLLTI